jgi:hypothetical protein
MARTPNAAARIDPGQTDPQEDLPKAGPDDTPQASALADAGKRDEDAKPGEDFAVPGNDPSSVEKVSVKTSGAFILQDPYTFEDFSEEPKEVVKTTFVTDELEKGRLVEA